MKKGFIRLWSLLTTLLLLAVAVLAVLLVGVRVIGYTPYTILSSSMAPEYQVGDLVYVKATPPEEIAVGDVITFVYDENLTVVTHRVVDVSKENRCFQTKGDANDQPDGTPVIWENVLGTAEFSLPYLGYLSSYISTASGRYAGIAVGLFLLLMILLPETGKKAGKSDEGKTTSESEYKQDETNN